MRYFAGLLAVVAFIILVVVVIAHNGPQTETSKTANGTQIRLTDYINKNSEVHLYIDGQINAIENHRAVEIIVSPSSRAMTVYKGYNLDVFRRQTYPNNQAAYDNFVRAVAKLNFVKERSGVKLTDERGVCPGGNRFIYELRENGKNVTRLWNSSCGSGTFAGTGPAIRDLFAQQIPDYNQLLTNVNIF